MNRVRQVREERGLTVLQLARAARVSRQTVYNVELELKMPTLPIMRRIAAALRADVAYLWDLRSEAVA